MKVGIIGAGLAGLTCAWYLKKNGVDDIVVYDSSEKAGGKLKTDEIDGFQLDRGFQVLLPAYPEAKKILDYDLLELQKFAKGSLILKNHKKIPFYDPENGISALIKTLLKGPGTFMDKLKLLKLKWKLSRISVERIFESEKSMSSLTYLQEFGFSEKIITEFWIPFYQGVFLENNLETDFKVLQFTFKMFAEAGAAVPKNGMGAIPDQLIEFIGREKVRTNTTVQNYTSTSITNSKNETELFDIVVIAFNNNENKHYQSVTNAYFEADKLPISTKHVILNANPNKIINNVVMMSEVAPNYAKNGKHLISVSANGTYLQTDVFRRDLKTLFGAEVEKWRHVKSYTIQEALPIVENGQKKYTSMREDHLFHCGDHLLQASINGAMQSGRITAEAILKKIKKIP